MQLPYTSVGETWRAIDANTLIDKIQNASTGHIHNGVDAKAGVLSQISLADNFYTNYPSDWIERTGAFINITPKSNRVLVHISSDWLVNSIFYYGDVWGRFRLRCVGPTSNLYTNIGGVRVAGYGLNLATSGFVGGTYLWGVTPNAGHRFSLECKSISNGSGIRNDCAYGHTRCKIIIQEI